MGRAQSGGDSPDCPNREQLVAFSLGQLPLDVAEAVALHLERCSTCVSTLAALDNQTDNLIAQLREPAKLEPAIDDSDCQRVIELVEALGQQPLHDPSQPAVEQEVEDTPPTELGEYRLLKKLGQGGMGTVYKAVHTKLDRVVAVKVIQTGQARSDRTIARFRREMKTVGRLDHRNIVRALDAGEQEGTHYLVMEYVDGIDVSKVARCLGPLPIADAVDLARQVSVGLQHIHEHGLVHRDLKPSNLILTPDGRVKILDLGLARLQAEQTPGEEVTATGQTVGTADYMAPEQISDVRAVDIRADIYSLGCTLYRLLTGQAPFGGAEYESQFLKMVAHLQEPIPSVRLHRREVPRSLAKVLDRLLAKDPADRYAAPAEATKALSKFTSGADLGQLLVRARERMESSDYPSEASGSTENGLSSAMARTRPSVAKLRGQIAPRSPRRRWRPLIVAAMLVLVVAVGMWPFMRRILGPSSTVRITYNFQPLPAPGAAMAADVADLNGDGHLDIVGGYFRSPGEAQSNYVYWGQGNREFELEESFGGGTGVFGLRLAELTGDKRPDVLVLHNVEDFPSQLFENMGDRFEPRPANLAKGDLFGPRGNGCQGLALGDLDRDGDLDAVSGHRGGYLYISLNDGRGNFQRSSLDHFGQHNDVEIADMDGDGHLDIIDAGAVDGWAGHAAIYWNSGDAGFSEHTLLHNVPDHMSVSVGDIDSDGDMDIALGIAAPDPAVIYRNEGKRRFVVHAEFQPHQNVRIADLDGNGTAELIAGGIEGNTRELGRKLHIYWECSPDTRVDTYLLPGSVGYLQDRALVVADFDADGTNDIFVGGNADSNCILWGKRPSPPQVQE